MFAEIHKKRIEKWEGHVIQHFLDSFQKYNWENVYLNEITEDDYGKYIEVIPAIDIISMTRRLIRNKPINRSIQTRNSLIKKVNSTLHIQPNNVNKKPFKLFVSNELDLVFLRQTKYKKNEKQHENEKTEKDVDPLRMWCQEFLKDYESSCDVDKSMESIPDYKPTNNQIKKLQKQREKDLLTWGSNF